MTMLSNKKKVIYINDINLYYMLMIKSHCPRVYLMVKNSFLINKNYLFLHKIHLFYGCSLLYTDIYQHTLNNNSFINILLKLKLRSLFVVEKRILKKYF